MIPLALDPRRAQVAVAGRGEAAKRRAEILARGADHVPLYTDRPDSVGALPEKIALRQGLPGLAAFSGLRLLWIAGLPDDAAAMLAAEARRARVLVNVEDAPAQCDFHSVAEVRRGNLLIAISTGGQSPGLAARVRRWIAGAFGPEWAGRTAALGAQRTAWKQAGAPMPELARRTEAAITDAGWLR